jgi:hypothetical protein
LVPNTRFVMKLQFLVHPQHRSPEAIARVKQIAQSLGIVPTAEGAATISAEADPATFQSLFGIAPDEKLFANPATNQTLPVPDPLKDYVQSISVAPRHVYMNKPAI